MTNYRVDGRALIISTTDKDIWLDHNTLYKYSNTGVDTLLLEEGIESIRGDKSLVLGPAWIKTVIFPVTLIWIDKYAFQGFKGLETLSLLSPRLESLGESAFQGCTSLKTVHFFETLHYIGDNCFKDCVALENIEFPKSLSSLGEYAFSNCTSLKSVRLPKLPKIKDGVFNQCSNLRHIDIPEGVTSIGEFAFSSTGLTELTLPSSLEKIGDCAFGIAPSVTVFIPADAPVYTSGAFQNMEDLPYYRVLPSTNPSPANTSTQGGTTTTKGDKHSNPLLPIIAAIVCFAIVASALSFSHRGGNGSGSLIRPSTPQAFSETSIITNNSQSIIRDVESQLSSVTFQKGTIIAPNDEYDTWLMSADITDQRIGKNVYLYQNSEGNYTELLVPVYFTLQIHPTAAFAEDVLENMVGYWRFTDLKVNSEGTLEYNDKGMSTTYFTSEDVLVEKGLDSENLTVITMP